MRSTLGVLALVAMVTVAGCDDPASVDGGLTTEEAIGLSTAMAEDGFVVTGDMPGADDAAGAVVYDPVTSTTQFTTTRTCPAGGVFVVAGTRTRTWDRDTRSGTADVDLTKTHEDCARVMGDVLFTLNGDPDIAVEAHHAWENGTRSGLQTLSMQGAFTWAADDGREGRCEVDVEAEFDPETNTRTVAGTVCNRTFERKTTWTGGQGGA